MLFLLARNENILCVKLEQWNKVVRSTTVTAYFGVAYLDQLWMAQYWGCVQY